MISGALHPSGESHRYHSHTKPLFSVNCKKKKKKEKKGMDVLDEKGGNWHRSALPELGNIFFSQSHWKQGLQMAGTEGDVLNNDAHLSK